MTTDLDTWDPLGVDEVVALFRPARFRWWISGGRALELHAGRSWRLHDDVDTGRSENNLWCRRSPRSPWALDVTVGAGDDHRWVDRRDPTVERRWVEAVLRTHDGVPYLAPELQLLFKITNPRPKDDIDATTMIPALAPERRSWLAAHLPTDHRWQEQISRHSGRADGRRPGRAARHRSVVDDIGEQLR